MYIRNVDEHRQITLTWAAKVQNINAIEWPESFNQDTDIKGKYNRFTGYVKEWIYGILSDDPKKRDITGGPLIEDEYFHRNISPNWWKLAIKKSNDKLVEGLPKACKKSYKEDVYAKFLPVYRAIEESFCERPWYQWFTNHAQYTAERDAMKAIKGIVMAVTNSSSERFETMYYNYCESVPMRNREPEKAVEEANQEIKQNDKQVDKDINKQVDKEVNKEVNKEVDNNIIDQQADVKDENKQQLIFENEFDDQAKQISEPIDDRSEVQNIEKSNTL